MQVCNCCCTDLVKTLGHQRNVQKRAESQHTRTHTVLRGLPLARMTVAVGIGWYTRFACQVSRDFVKLQGFWVSFQNTFHESGHNFHLLTEIWGGTGSGLQGQEWFLPARADTSTRVPLPGPEWARSSPRSLPALPSSSAGASMEK